VSATSGLLAAVLAASACAGPERPVASAPLASPATPATAAPSLVSAAPPASGRSSAAAPPGCRTVAVAAGDIVNDVPTARRTGRLAQAQRPALVLALGDNQYPRGSLPDYRAKYASTSWGSLKPLTKPVPGNHEYLTRGAAGYFAYFGNPPPYYAYDAGCGWRGYALDSENDIAAQATWLRRELAAHPSAAVLATWHRPRYSSGVEHGGDARVQPFWDALGRRRGVVLNGHEHNYERFAPRGQLREFVVGTGGTSTYRFGRPAAGSRRRVSGTPGVLRLELFPGGAYRWAFLSTVGTVVDQGSA
jgi:alkaline phosphatase